MKIPPKNNFIEETSDPLAVLSWEFLRELSIEIKIILLPEWDKLIWAKANKHISGTKDFNVVNSKDENTSVKIRKRHEPLFKCKLNLLYKVYS